MTEIERAELTWQEIFLYLRGVQKFIQRLWTKAHRMVGENVPPTKFAVKSNPNFSASAPTPSFTNKVAIHLQTMSEVAKFCTWLC